MKRIALMLAAALAAACSDGGGNTTPDSGTSVTPPVDSGTPANDGSAQPDSPTSPEDAAVPQDVPSTTVDMPATMTSLCQDPMCSDQTIVSDDGSVHVERAQMACSTTTDGLTIDLTPYGIQAIAACNQSMNVCGAETRVRTIAMDGTDVMIHARFQIQRDMSNMTCSRCGRFTLTSMEDGDGGRMLSAGMTCAAR